MNTLRHKRRLLLGPAFWLLVPFCTMAFLAGPSSAETLRTELYQFQLPRFPAQSGQADPQVYMRVSNADRLISDPAAPLEAAAAEGASHVALFEFFLGPDQSGLSLSRVRFQNSVGLQCPLTRLHGVLSSEVAGPLRSSAEVDFTGGSFTVDLQRVGGYAGDVVGLMFELAPSALIDTLLGQQLTGGHVQPEVEVHFPGGSSLWVVAVTQFEVHQGSSSKQSIVTSCGCPSALTVSLPQQAAADSGVLLVVPPTVSGFFREVDSEMSTLIPRGRRAREPPH